MELKNLVAGSDAELTATIEYVISELDEGINFHLSYLDRNDFQKLNNQCTKVTFDKKTHQPTPTLDEEKLRKLFIEKCVKGWEGMTFRKLGHLVPLDREAFHQAVREGKEAKIKITLDSDVAFDPDLLAVVMAKAFGLENWLTNQATNISNFQSDFKDLEEGLKKSKASPGGNSQEG